MQDCGYTCRMWKGGGIVEEDKDLPSGSMSYSSRSFAAVYASMSACQMVLDTIF